MKSPLGGLGLQRHQHSGNVKKSVFGRDLASGVASDVGGTDEG